MTTSLSEQLKRLSVPQSSIYKEKRKKASLLFDPKDAAAKDRDTFYEIGLSGLNELITIYDGFAIFRDSLFSLSFKNFERAVESKEVNETLDRHIQQFLSQLAPYFLLQSSHKALEWLINRFHIHEYNQDDILALILPYHETIIFVRFLQILNLKKISNRWNWLEPLQKPGIPLSKQVLFNHCASSTSFIGFLCEHLARTVKHFGSRAYLLTTLYGFFGSAIIGAIETAKVVNEGLITTLLPVLLAALESQIVDYKSLSYMVFGFLITKVQLKKITLNKIMTSFLNSDPDLSYNTTLLLNLVYKTQDSFTEIPDQVLYDLSANSMQNLCVHINQLIEKNINVKPFLLALLRTLLTIIQSDSSEFKRFSNLPEILIDEVDFKTQDPDEMILCVFNCYNYEEGSENDGYGSDIEIVEEENGIKSNPLTLWYSSLLKSLEQKYPVAFDNLLKSGINGNGRLSEAKCSNLRVVLSFVPGVVHKLGDTFLFENLLHVNPQMRIQAVQYLGKHSSKLISNNSEFVKDSVINRLNDDNSDVVAETLKIIKKDIIIVIGKHELLRVLIPIIYKGHKKGWSQVGSAAITLFNSLKLTDINQDILYAIFPYLFPTSDKSFQQALSIMESHWGKSFPLTALSAKVLKSSKAEDAASICESVFVTLESGKWVNDDSIQTFMLGDVSDTMKLLTYILTKSSLLPEEYSEDKLTLLNTLIDLTKASDIVTFEGNIELSGELISESFNLSKQNKISYQVIYYVLEKLVQKTSMNKIPKPWAEYTRNSECVFIRKLFEFLVTGCTLKYYGQYYGTLLSTFLKRNFSKLEEKLNFIANFACGHIVCSNNVLNLIRPDFQLRSLKLFKKILDEQKDLTLVSTLQLQMALLLCLTSEHSMIRACGTLCMDAIVRVTAAKHNSDFTLLTALLAKKEEILLDSESISLILYTLLSQQKSVRIVLQPKMQVKMKNVLQEMLKLICSAKTPIHIKSAVTSLLVHINSKEIFEKLAPIGVNIFKNFKNDGSLNCDVYESTFLRNLYSRIDETVAPHIGDDIIWTVIEMSLKNFRPIIYNSEKILTAPCTMMMKQINANLFKLFPTDKAAEVISLICYAGTFGNHTSIISAAAKLMKRLDIKSEHFTHIINNMLEVKDPSPKKKTRVLVNTLMSHRVVETEQWRCGLTLLEYIQNRKNAVLNPTLLPLLFKLLQKCLECEEQSYVEYTKQLIMSSIFGYCQKFTDNKAKKAADIKVVFDIELIVKCIRGTQNPQTHHHALMLLSHAAALLPEQVLNHTMAIFTFIGSSVLRHDDAYSFQIIIKIIETIIPILVKLDTHKDRTSVELQKRVVPLLRIFSDVVLDVPGHRRLPLYKKFIETLGSKDFLWTFIALLLESHIAHWSEHKDDKIGNSRFLYDRERPAGRQDFAQSLMAEFPLDVVLSNDIKLLTYVNSLPLKKDDNLMEVDEDASVIFSINDHTAFQLRHYKYVVITFLNTCLSSPNFVQLVRTQTNELQVESLYKSFIVKILVYIQSVSKVTDQASSKYWKVMLHHSYDLLDNVNNLLSAPMFISVFRGLMNHTLLSVRRKAMELLNNKIQYDPDMFTECNKSLVNSLIPAVMETVSTISTERDVTVDHEVELNQQTALLSLKLLTRLIGGEDPEPLRPLLELITNYTCQKNISGNLMASIVLCLAELCSNLKAHAISSLPKFMPALISILRKQRKADAPELILLSTVTALWKIVENLPHFLSPYLSQILYEYSLLTVKWQKSDQDCAKVSAVVTKLNTIKEKISSAIAPRILIPEISKCYQSHFSKENYDAIRPVMSVLTESFSTLTSADFTTLQQDLTALFLNVLQLRSNLADKTNVTENQINYTEDEIINALVGLVLKLSETSFRPFYFKIYDWAIRTNVENQKDRTITFYRLSSAIAEKLKGLFVLFAGHFVKNAADLLDACNKTKVDELYFHSEEKCIVLVENILKTLQVVFLYDSQNFINKEKFETLMQPIVDQFENTLGGISALQERSKSLLIPCVTQFVVAIADDSLWKPLNYQVLLKTRHNDAEIRLVALDCLVSMAKQLGSSWLPLLAESVPFLAELLEDGDYRIEAATKDAIRQLEEILGEPLQKYF